MLSNISLKPWYLYSYNLQILLSQNVIANKSSDENETFIMFYKFHLYVSIAIKEYTSITPMHSVELR